MQNVKIRYNTQNQCYESEKNTKVFTDSVYGSEKEKFENRESNALDFFALVSLGFFSSETNLR